MHFRFCVLLAMHLIFAHADQLQFFTPVPNSVLYKDQAVNISYVAIHSDMAGLQWAQLDLQKSDNNTVITANISSMTPDEIFATPYKSLLWTPPTALEDGNYSLHLFGTGVYNCHESETRRCNTTIQTWLPIRIEALPVHSTSVLSSPDTPLAVESLLEGNGLDQLPPNLGVLGGYFDNVDLYRHWREQTPSDNVKGRWSTDQELSQHQAASSSSLLSCCTTGVLVATVAASHFLALL